jgi:hypothetical protein
MRKAMTEQVPSFARVLDLERESDPDGEWIPYCVRMKLDLAGLKIGLEDWQTLSADARAALVAAPVADRAERDAFAALIRREADAAGARCAALPEPKRALVETWRDAAAPSEPQLDVLAKLAGSRTEAAVLWSRLDLFGRYLVHAFARKGDANTLARALAELGVRTS